MSRVRVGIRDQGIGHLALWQLPKRKPSQLYLCSTGSLLHADFLPLQAKVYPNIILDARTTAGKGRWLCKKRSSDQSTQSKYSAIRNFQCFLFKTGLNKGASKQVSEHYPNHHWPSPTSPQIACIKQRHQPTNNGRSILQLLQPFPPYPSLFIPFRRNHSRIPASCDFLQS